MAPLLIVIGLILGIAVFTSIDDIISGRHYKSDAEKTEEDRRKERELDNELHRIMWE
jgi:hypothetical protein